MSTQVDDDDDINHDDDNDDDYHVAVVKLRQGSGKDWQGMALKAKGLKA